MTSRSSAYFHLLRSYFFTTAAALVACTCAPLQLRTDEAAWERWNRTCGCRQVNWEGESSRDKGIVFKMSWFSLHFTAVIYLKIEISLKDVTFLRCTISYSRVFLIELIKKSKMSWLKQNFMQNLNYLSRQFVINYRLFLFYHCCNSVFNAFLKNRKINLINSNRCILSNLTDSCRVLMLSFQPPCWAKPSNSIIGMKGFASSNYSHHIVSGLGAANLWITRLSAAESFWLERVNQYSGIVILAVWNVGT